MMAELGEMHILAGDIGGTKTLLQLSCYGPGKAEVLHAQRYASEEFDAFNPLVSQFVAEALRLTGIRPSRACFGVAGPVSGRLARTTNLPWTLDADALETSLGIERVRLINDFQSVGYGIDALKDEDIVTLQQGHESPQGTRVILGAGTGLGQALLVWQKDHYEVVATEGGHADFAPADEDQIDLLRYLQKRYRHATWEHAVSGRGLVNIFEFLLERGRLSLSEPLQQAMAADDPAAVISGFGMANRDPTAAKALQMFVTLYGAQAGNLALTGLATGGVYLAGGVAAKIIDKLGDGNFLAAFNNKEARMQSLLKDMPVRVIVNPEVGLLGAVIAASRL